MGNASPPGRRSRGLSLVELMIGMALGLLALTTALTAFGGISTLSRNVRGSAGVAQNAAISLGYLQQQVQRAGYVDLMNSDGAPAVLYGLDNSGTFTTSTDGSLVSAVFQASYPGLRSLHGCNGSYQTVTSLLNYQCITSASDLAGSLTVAYQALATPPTGWAGQSLASTYGDRVSFATDCAGRATRSADNNLASPSGDVVVNRYYLDTTNKSLRCVGNGNPASSVEVASNVEQFRVLYGVAQTSGATPGEAVAQYLSASSVAGSSGGWGNVIAVQVCLLMVSDPAQEIGRAHV
jgi:type IV pilus assembly protein PilW